MTKELPDTIDNKNEIDLPRIINSEVNLLIFPFFLLERTNKKLETEYRDIVQRNEQTVEIIWNVSANPKYGYPGPFDREVHKALEQIISEILKEKGEVKNPITFSIYELCKRMGISFKGGGNFEKVRQSLEKIRATTIKSEGALYYKREKKWLSKVFGIYDGVIFRGDQIEGDIVAETNLLYLSDIYLQNINSFYIKPIDYNYMKSLESKIASRLYEILGVKFYGLRNKRGAFICYRYSKLCRLLPVKPQKYLSLARQQLDPGNNELKDTGFISQFKWSENGKNDWLLYYWPGERARKEMRSVKEKNIDFEDDIYLPEFTETDDTAIKKDSRADKNLTARDDVLIGRLTALNVSKITAIRLVKNYEHNRIKDWIEAIEYCEAGDKAAYIVKAIKEGWNVPEEYLKEKEEIIAKEKQDKLDNVNKKESEKNEKIIW
ncbi:MAG: replication initiator protein A [Bacteroidales bacterium]|jgi:hypothetical protein|nr:replication initiator protein A [Bacteroidales bacterium]